MALVGCSECGKKISNKAPACPYCGYPIAAAKSEKAQSFAGMGCGAVFVLLIGFVAYAVHEGGEIMEREKANPTCISDYTKCSDNRDVVEHHESNSGIPMHLKCESAAEEAARYGSPAFPSPSFDSFRSGRSYLDSGIAILIEPNAKFKNGFGAAESVVATCFYDMKKDQATVQTSPK